ncbi:MAG: Smr/MutS family protein, partial [Hydrogenovibrio crunogenus]|uniref:Smr domain-containing protein n=1 Tax=Hydrogenovibrio crunogenus (strain DSM 25203 / XCL-2) TaxID=317025 RepID=Q31G70_HYDCU|nr:Smr/MutS family protein [Hydrogenovibrio crunogenus]
MSNISDEDKSLFADAVQGVKKLNQDKKVVPHQTSSLKPKVRRHSPLNDKSPYGHSVETASFSQVTAHESLTYQQPSVHAQDMKRLKNGKFHTHWQLDLHGYTEDQADKILKDFLIDAIQQQARYLIIVHGKGYNSKTDFPVLKNLVNQRLPQVPQVLAYCSAQPKDGGTGAVYVFLKKKS